MKTILRLSNDENLTVFTDPDDIGKMVDKAARRGGLLQIYDAEGDAKKTIWVNPAHVLYVCAASEQLGPELCDERGMPIPEGEDPGR